MMLTFPVIVIVVSFGHNQSYFCSQPPFSTSSVILTSKSRQHILFWPSVNHYPAGISIIVRGHLWSKWETVYSPSLFRRYFLEVRISEMTLPARWIFIYIRQSKCCFMVAWTEKSTPKVNIYLLQRGFYVPQATINCLACPKVTKYQYLAHMRWFWDKDSWSFLLCPC